MGGRGAASGAKGGAKLLDKSAESGIIKGNDSRTAVQDVHYIGKINLEIYKCVSEDIQTDEVIITDERIQHIKERHPQDFERFCGYMREIVERPEYIMESKKPNTAFVLKRIVQEEKNFQLILRLKTSNDCSDYQNSVITFLKVDDKKAAKYLRNKKILYKRLNTLDNDE